MLESLCIDKEVNAVQIQSNATDTERTEQDQCEARTSNCDSNENENADISNQQSVSDSSKCDKEDSSNEEVFHKDKESVGSECNARKINFTKENGSKTLDESRNSDIFDMDHVDVQEDNCESEKMTEETNNQVNGKNDDKDDCDPLNIDHDFDIKNKTTDVDENDKTESTETKKEPTFKIKCVDIKKLMETPNNSVVIISDSENEVSPLKKKKVKRETSEKAFPKIGGEITVTKVPPKQKKVIVLDDTDSSDSNSFLRKKRTKTDSPKKRPVRETRRTSQALKSEKSSSNVTRSGRQLRTRRPVRTDLTNVSSLSDSSSSSSSESDSSIVGSNTKKTRRKTKQINNESTLLNSLEDKKFSCKCYIPLTRISPERLKKNYEKKLLKKEIEQLVEKCFAKVEL